MQRVLWTKGLLLSPQHLQAQDRFLEDLLEFRLSSLTYCPWGFKRLEIDREALTGGALSIARAEGILPDGLLFDVPDSDPPPRPLVLEDQWEPDMEALEVVLALPERKSSGLNVAGEAGGDTRYRAEVMLLRDENTGLQEKPVQVARKNFSLLAGSRRGDRSTRLPVARIQQSSAGEFVLDPHFVPPVVDVTASPYLQSLLRGLVENLSARSSALGEMRGQRSKGLADFGVADIANFWLLYTVNAHLPVLRHLYETRRGHPADVFESLLNLGGALTTFSPKLSPRDLPGYEHSNLEACFTSLDAMIRELLDTVVPARHASLPLARTSPSIYATAIDQERFLDAPQIFLAVQAEVDESDLTQRAPHLFKVGSGGRIDSLIGQALPGVGLRHIPRPPSALPVKLDYHYFELDRTGTEWTAVRTARNLAVYVPTEFPSPRIELVVLLPRE
jgi:type VI secretion system protein ImpJ